MKFSILILSFLLSLNTFAADVPNISGTWTGVLEKKYEGIIFQYRIVQSTLEMHLHGLISKCKESAGNNTGGPEYLGPGDIQITASWTMSRYPLTDVLNCAQWELSLKTSFKCPHRSSFAR
jgi:hypothetical protein